LISQQEHEAWEVLLACQGQMRLAPSSHVIGIDMDAALKIAHAQAGASSQRHPASDPPRVRSAARS
jgi:hypothetical protein